MIALQTSDNGQLSSTDQQTRGKGLPKGDGLFFGMCHGVEVESKRLCTPLSRVIFKQKGLNTHLLQCLANDRDHCFSVALVHALFAKDLDYDFGAQVKCRS